MVVWARFVVSFFFLSEFYEPNALMMEEEGAVIAGLLVGLNVIDANLCMKGEDLDSQVFIYLFLLYSSNGWQQMIGQSIIFIALSLPQSAPA